MKHGILSIEYVVWCFALATLVVTIVYPLAMLIYASITSDHKITFAAFTKMLEDKHLPEYIINTVNLALVVTLFSTLIGVLLAWLVVRTDIPGKNIIRTLAILPFVFPPYIEAMAWISFADPAIGVINKLYRLLGGTGYIVNIYSFWGLVTVMALRFYVYVFLTTSSALEQIDPSLEEAARMSGAPILRVARDITIPLVMPSIIAGSLLAFVATCGNFGIPALIGDRAHYYVLTTRIYSVLSIPDLDRAAAYSLVLLLISIPLLLLQKYVLRGKKYVTITGRATKPSVMSLGRVRYIVFALLLVFMVPTIVFPITTLVLTSFMKSVSHSIFDVNSYTFKNLYEVLFEDPDTRTAITDSLVLALSSATSISLFGALIAYIIVKTKIKGKVLLEWISSVPFTLPGMVFAISMVFAFIKTPLYNTLMLVFIAYFARYLSYGVRSSIGALLQIDPSLEEAARVSGANWLRTLRDVVLPLLKAGIVSGWILVFMPTLSELTVSIILAPPIQPTIGVAVYNLMEEGNFEWAYALSTIVVVVVLAGHMLINLITRKVGIKSL